MESIRVTFYRQLNLTHAIKAKIPHTPHECKTLNVHVFNLPIPIHSAKPNQYSKILFTLLSLICAARAGTKGTGSKASSPRTARNFQGLKLLRINTLKGQNYLSTSKP